jgi:hypothetical protein
MLVQHGVFFALGILIYLSRSRSTLWHFVIVLVGAAVLAIDARAEWHHRAFAHLPHKFLPVLVWLLALARLRGDPAGRSSAATGWRRSGSPPPRFICCTTIAVSL